jgi:hypothetical protein
VFVISLDFELHWGVCDRLTVDDYRENLLGVRQAIPAMLSLFREFGIHATWATVGFLFFDRRECLLAAAPAERPTYADPGLSSYNVLPTLGSDEAADPYHFGRSLLEQIRDTPHQEIATHTFSHYYCLERGQTVDQFRADLLAAREAARRLGVELVSIVFPRNQVARPYLEVCADLGISAYRGNERTWFYRPATQDSPGLLRRAMRLADTYVNLSGHHAVSPSDAVEQHLVNVPASRFLRPYNRRLRPLEPLKLRRITGSMTHAAERGLLYHLWWHPHNFGRDVAKNVRLLTAILEHFSRLSASHGLRTLTMSEVATELRLAG